MTSRTIVQNLLAKSKKLAVSLRTGQSPTAPLAPADQKAPIADGITEMIQAFTSNEPLDVIVSPNEISFAHGTGVLLSRLLEGKTDFVALRSRNDYGGYQRISPKAAHVLPPGTMDRRVIFSLVGEWLKGVNVRQIICVPYFATDLTIAIAARAITGAPLGVWVMDDNCLKHDGISRELMGEALNAATARFAISAELKREYQTAFQKPFAIIPPLVTPKMVRTKPAETLPKSDAKIVMIGNLWSPKILDQLSSTIAKAGINVHWHCENPDLWQASVPNSVLEKRGINLIANRSPEEIQRDVEEAKAIILPSDPGKVGNHETALGDMSLPTRLPFVMATSGTPVIVMARPGTAAGNFVERFKIGAVVPYDAKELKSVIGKLSTRKEQKRIRVNAAKHASDFSFDGAFDFIAATIADGGRWPDDRFESVNALNSNTYALYVDRPAPAQFAEHFTDIVSVCDRLRGIGYEPDWILDVGASTAIWSRAVETVFDNTRYILCDPMFSRYDKVWSNPHYELIEAAISDKEGEISFSVSSDLYGSSLIQVSDIVDVVDQVTVPMRTVDAIAGEKKIKGRGLLKVDVQFAEHLVIDGALKLISKQTDIVILELTLPRVAKNSKTFLEMCKRMDELGFRIFDIAGNWRIPRTGELEQVDIVFAREDLKGITQSVNL